MVTSLTLYLTFLGLLYVERGVELLISRRNARRALNAGGVETGRDHYRIMAIFHALFPLACAVEVVLLSRPFPGAVGYVALILALASQLLRYWSIAALGRYWNVRVIVQPRQEIVTRGPYHYLRHPNYLAVVVEMAAVPLIHGAWLTAIIFSVGNLLLLRVRIRAEESALEPGYDQAFTTRSSPTSGARRA